MFRDFVRPEHAFDRGRLYVGATVDLLRRVREELCGRSCTMSNAALRRALVERLGIAKASDIRSGIVQPSAMDAERVVVGSERCDVARRSATPPPTATHCPISPGENPRRPVAESGGAVRNPLLRQG